MALTRKFLTALGIESEKIDEIITAHTDTVNALKEERDGYKVDAEKYEEAQKELSELKKTIKEAKAKDSFEDKYNTLQAEFDKYKADIAAKETQARKVTAFRGLLKESGVSDKRIDSIIKVSGETISGIEFDDEGKIKGADTVKESIKTEWADFIGVESNRGADVGNPPKDDDGKPVKTTGRAAELAAKYHDNLYGKAKEE